MLVSSKFLWTVPFWAKSCSQKNFPENVCVEHNASNYLNKAKAGRKHIISIPDDQIDFSPELATDFFHQDLNRHY